jgi:hypothetical protein
MKSPSSAISYGVFSSSSSSAGARDREHVLDDDPLRKRGFVVVVDDHDAVDLALRVELGEPVRDADGVRVRRPVGEVDPGLVDVVAPEAKRRAALLPDDDPACALSLAARLALERKGPAEDLRVEGAGQAAVAGDRKDGDRADIALLEQRELPRRGRPRGADHQLAHAVGVGAKRLDPSLRPPELRRGDELHGLRDLPRVADGAKAPLDVLDGGQSLLRGRSDEALLFLDREARLELLDLGRELLLELVGRSFWSRISS